MGAKAEGTEYVQLRKEEMKRGGDSGLQIRETLPQKDGAKLISCLGGQDKG